MQPKLHENICLYSGSADLHREDAGIDQQAIAGRAAECDAFSSFCAECTRRVG